MIRVKLTLQMLQTLLHTNPSHQDEPFQSIPYFNPNCSTTLQTDASKRGLGAVLLQNSKPVMFVSRALTGSERNYQNLERECLVTIWGMEKVHYFLYGKEFTLGHRSETISLNTL